MSMRELEAAIELIAETATDTRLKGPRPTSLIDAAEAKLGVVFPPTYRRFLSEFGCGSVGAFEFYGVDEGAHTSFLSCVWSTLEARRLYGPPREFVVVAELGDGSYYVLDTGAQTPHGENPVLVWMPGGDELLTERDAADFGAFFLSMVQEEIADE